MILGFLVPLVGGINPAALLRLSIRALFKSLAFSDTARARQQINFLKFVASSNIYSIYVGTAVKGTIIGE